MCKHIRGCDHCYWFPLTVDAILYKKEAGSRKRILCPRVGQHKPSLAGMLCRRSYVKGWKAVWKKRWTGAWWTEFGSCPRHRKLWGRSHKVQSDKKRHREPTFPFKQSLNPSGSQRYREHQTQRRSGCVVSGGQSERVREPYRPPYHTYATQSQSISSHLFSQFGLFLESQGDQFVPHTVLLVSICVSALQR